MRRSIWRVVVTLGMSACLLLGIAQAQAQTDGESDGLWFNVDTLNEGLGEPPEGVSRSTPREAIRSFLTLTDQEEYADAAHILNLADIDAVDQRERGAELARQLAEVFKRGDWLTASSLSSRQDAAIESTAGENPLAGQPRRDIELTALESGGEAYDIRMGRYSLADNEPVWLIMPESVASISTLYDAYGPSWFEQQLPERLKVSLGPLMVWEWIAIPLFLLLIAALGWIINKIVAFLAHLLPAGGVSIFVTRIKLPVSLLVIAFITRTMLDYVVSFSAMATTTFRVLLVMIIAWSLGSIALRLVDTIMLNMARKLVGEIDDTKSRDERRFLTSLYAARRAIILLTVVVVSLYVLGQIQLFETLGLSILASASVLAVLVGIAGQAVLGNILSSFQLSLAKPIRVGDLVMFEGQWSYVEGIFYTYIRLRVWDERRLIVPVTYFVSKPFENLSVKSSKLYRYVELTLHISANINTLRKKFLEYAEQQEHVVENHRLMCAVTAQNGSQQTLTCYFVTAEPLLGWYTEVELREKMLTFIRDHHPEWWPRDIMVMSHEDIAKGEGAKMQKTIMATSEPKPKSDD
ncbi:MULTISPECIES: mechanosensitive ion channel family protein [unclassified Halomonas]|uniref:mechanosensitive ion channel family protein n=1 Tax=unclassified Halomonas TaxID=2609666 RepID=UPI00209DFBB5|nr:MULTISPECIES: mechanosensitive ion channel domain-containing protein [unclassified Halomonas]MCP1314772.1 mechanosensitive ion channel family protein [Halomonas sp. 707D7]MCP1327944.1 mechanosensitive ion channel family protein [Halomonas sp. 707D4]